MYGMRLAHEKKEIKNIRIYFILCEERQGDGHYVMFSGPGSENRSFCGPVVGETVSGTKGIIIPDDSCML